MADDSQPIRERLVKRISQFPDIQIREAVDTPDALRQTATFMPDVAVLDIRMPGGGGIVALGEIRKMKPDTTVIIMTNYPYVQYRRKCLDSGADFFFDKSTEFEQVAETILQLMHSGKTSEVAHHTAAAQLLAAKEEIEKTTQRQRDMGLLSLLQKPGAKDSSDQAYGMWEKTFDAIPDMVAIFDPDHTIVRVNRALADWLDLPAVALTGKKCFEMIHGTGCPVSGCPHEALLKDHQKHVSEVYYENLGGWFEICVSPVFEKDELIGVIHIAHETTLRKRAEAYRDAGQKILEVLNSPEEQDRPIQRVLDVLKKQTGFDAVGIRLKDGDDFPYFVQDGFSSDFLLTENTLIERGADGGVCRNPDGSICLECTCGLVLSGKTDPSNPFFTKGGSFWTNDSFPLLDLPADQDPRLHPRNNCIHQGYASVALVPIRSKNQIVGLMQFNDRRKNLFTVDDIELLEQIASHIGGALLHKQAEQAVAESELRYRRLFESMQSGFALHEIVCDKKGVPCDYRFLEINPAFETLTGLKAEEIVGRTVKEVMPETEACWIENYGKVALTGTSMQVRDFSGVLGRHYSVSAYSPRHGQFAAIFTDITDQKNTEEAFHRACGVAEEANRAKTQFLANMSHELRTPLNAIIGLSELLIDSELDEEQRDYIQTIGNSGESLLTLIAEMLDFSRIELGKLEVKNEPFRVREVVGTSTALLADFAAKKGITLSAEIDEAVSETIIGDPARLQQILVNLLNNALKFTEQGFVKLTVARRCVPSGSVRVMFEVADSGEGMDEATMKRIFKPFQQGDNSNKREHGGAGLGLAISKNLVEMMGGLICVESCKGRGSVFKFYLMDTAVPQPKISVSEVRDQCRGRRLCVWGDDPSDMRTAEHLLERCGVLPRYAESLDEIKARLSEDVPADAVLCNLDLPGLPERLLEFRKLRPDIPWIGFSNWMGPLDEQLKSCFAAFIDRPLSPDQLYGALMEISGPAT